MLNCFKDFNDENKIAQINANKGDLELEIIRINNVIELIIMKYFLNFFYEILLKNLIHKKSQQNVLLHLNYQIFQNIYKNKEVLLLKLLYILKRNKL